MYPKSNKDFQDNIRSLHAWIDQGNGFAIASSRELDGADQLFEALGIHGDFIGSNGGQIRFKDGSTRIYPLDPSILKDLKSYQDEYDFTYQFNCEGKVYGSDHHHFPFINNPKKMHCQRNHPIFQMDAIHDYCITQIKILVSPDQRDTLKAALNNRFKDGYTITTSDIDMIDIMANNIDKAHGALSIMSHYGLTIDDIYALGDGENDICLFETFKHHCVMDSAESNVLSHAKHQAKTVAQALQEWML